MTRQELETKLEESPLCVAYEGCSMSARTGTVGCIWISKRKQSGWSPYKSHKEWQALHENIQRYPFRINVCIEVPQSLEPGEDLPYYLSADTCESRENFPVATLVDVESILERYGIELSDIEASTICGQNKFNT